MKWDAIAMSRVNWSGSSSREGAQLSEGGCCPGDACQGIWWEPVNCIGGTPGLVVIATKLLVRETIVILIAGEIRSITRVTRLIFRVTILTGLMIRATRVTGLMGRMTGLMARVTGCASYRVSKFLLSPVHHISVWVAVMLGRRKGESMMLEIVSTKRLSEHSHKILCKLIGNDSD